jgi:alkaline phosphatase D
MADDTRVHRIVQFSDTHLSHRRSYGVENVWAVIDWINATGPDLVVHTGDIVSDDPDDPDERAFAQSVLDTVAPPLVVLPGNHDVGGFTGDLYTDDRNRAFVDAWGADTFQVDLGPWRCVGANVYRLGEDDHDGWLGESLTTDAHLALFLHQPPFLVAPHVADDGDWSLSTDRRAILAAAAGDRAALVAAGHVHRYRTADRVVCCPSASFVGHPRDDGSHYVVGCVEHRLYPDGTVESQLVIPPGVEPVFFADLARRGEASLRELPERPVPSR